MAASIKLRIRRDDTVVVISGKDRGRTGRVLRVDPKRSRVYVEGLNIVKRHQRATGAPGAVGGVVEKEGPIHISNVMLIGSENKPSRVSYDVTGDSKERVDRRTGNAIPRPSDK